MEYNLQQKLEQHGLTRWCRVVESDIPTVELTTSDPNEIKLAVSRINGKIDGDKRIIISSQLILEDSGDVGWNYSNCEFKKEVSFKKSQFVQPCYFNKCIFHETADFTDCKFNGNVRFHKATFIKSPRFTNSTFTQLVDFYFSEFQADMQFHLTDFEATAIFSNVQFQEPVQFLHNKVLSNSYLSFENAFFRKGLDLSRSNFWCTIQFWGTSFGNDAIELSRKSELFKTDNHESLEQVGEIGALTRLRETFRIIKNNMSSTGNHIEARNYHRLELSTYSRELSLTSWNQRLDEKVLLCLNKISNNHGLSWWQGFKFTSSLTFIFYLIYLIIISPELEFAFTWKAFGYTLKHYVELLNLTFWDYKPFGIDNEPWGFIFLFISRIFISYGYYQLIQSFRKFGKN